jgi:hypothetical protein
MLFCWGGTDNLIDKLKVESENYKLSSLEFLIRPLLRDNSDEILFYKT